MGRRHRHKYIGWYSAGRIHRKREFPSIVKALVLLAVISMAGLWLTCQQLERARHRRPQRLVSLSGDGAPDLAVFDGQVSLPSDPSAAGRVVYPYSVIPGGARDAADLRQAMADPVVGAHYADFQLTRAHLVTLRHDELYYVSYRRGGEIFWTKNKLRIAEGEVLLTDGGSYARTRCGNRLSRTAQSKTVPSEPSAEEFDTPVNPASRIAAPLVVRFASPSVPALAPPPAPANAGPPVALVPPAPAPEAPPVALTFPVNPPSILPPVRPGKKPNKCPPGSVSPNLPCKKRPLSPVPEPSTWLLMTAGVGLLAFQRLPGLRYRRLLREAAGA